MEEDTTGDQLENSKVPRQLQPFVYKKGQSGNPEGRPEGISMKEYLKKKFRTMTDEEREEYLDGLNKIDLMKMAEGNPESKTDVTSGGKPLILPATLIEKNDTPQNTGDSSAG